MIVLKHILVATDFSPASDAALTYGRALAKTFGARLHLLHVAENFFLRPTLTDPYALKAAVGRRLDERLTAEDRIERSAHAVLETSDHPADTIAEYAKSTHIDLIVMGTHGRTGVSHLLVGSVAERVVRTAPCPVLTVRHPEHEFVLPDAAASAREVRTS
jgi:Universal stress protein UspA and related nucleotide-binding proteins